MKTRNSDYCIKDDLDCFGNLARVIKDATLCEKLSNEKRPTVTITDRDWCYRDVAKTAIDIKICDKISDANTIIACRQDLERIIDCSKSPNKESCYTHQATYKLQIEKCQEIADVPTSLYTREGCKNQVTYADAVFNNDISKCDLVADEKVKNGCILELAVLNGDSQLCLKGAEGYQNSCFALFAKFRLDLDTCNKIGIRGSITKLQAEQARDSCFYSLIIGKKLGDEPCKMIANPETRENCFKSFSQ